MSMSRQTDKKNGRDIISRVRKKIRLAVFRRDKWKCKLCPFRGNSITLTMDHIIPKAKGGSWEMENLRTLCYPCHKKITKIQFQE